MGEGMTDRLVTVMNALTFGCCLWTLSTGSPETGWSFWLLVFGAVGNGVVTLVRLHRLLRRPA
jgi:hypothetical protein